MNGKRCKLEYDGMILDYPVYSNGKVHYTHPAVIPEEVKKLVLNEFLNFNKKKEENK
jgi:hypothetical protein